MKNILISGGAGFIGSRLCEELHKKGYNVTVLDNLSNQIHGNSILYDSIKEITHFIKGDIRKKSDWEVALKGQDIVVHLAAETGTGQSMYEIEKYTQVNILGTANLLDILANKKHNIKRMIISSSRSVYGEGKYTCSDHGVKYPSHRSKLDMENQCFDLKCEDCGKILNLQATDERSKINPLSIYGITKYQQEQMFMLMGKNLEIPAVALRYQNVYGPRQSLSNPYTGILSIFSTRILNGNDIDVYEDGMESRDFVFIDDAVDATILAIENSDANGQVFNVGKGENITVIDIAKKLKYIYNSSVNISVNGHYRLGDIRHNFADLKKSNEILGFQPSYSFNDGVKLFTEWVQTQSIEKDKYNISVDELKSKGLLK